MNTKRRWLITALVAVWVAGISIWGWSVLDFGDEPEPIVTESSPSATPNNDTDDRFQAFDALCEELDWSGLETAVGKVWTNISNSMTDWGVQPSQSQACQASAPSHDKTYATVSVGIYATAAQAISQYDRSALANDRCTESPREDLDDAWSRSWICAESIEGDDRMTYVVVSQVDNLVYRFNLIVPNTTEFQSEEYAAGIELESLSLGQQVQHLATNP